MNPSDFNNRRWDRDDYYVTTDPSGVSTAALIDIYNSDVFYWANAMPPEYMEAALRNSLSLCLFSKTTGALTGLSRCVTDFTTFMYLTDVWVDPAQQGKGLGKWMLKCINELIEEMPYLRRCMLFTTDWERSVPLYEKTMGMEVIEGRALATMEVKGRGHPMYGKKGSSYT